MDNASELSYELNTLKNILAAVPSSIFFKDTDCKYVFATHYWHLFDEEGADALSVAGKTDEELRADKHNLTLARESDLRILATGKGETYLMDSSTNQREEYLELIKNPVFNDDGEIIGIVGLINDVTERIVLQRKLEQIAHTDELTGFYNRRYLEKWAHNITPELYPISIISADCDNLKFVNDNLGHHVGDEVIKQTANVIQSAAPEDAVLLRVGGDEFTAILANTPADEATLYINRMREAESATIIEGFVLSISYGQFTLEGPHISFDKGLIAADKGMYQEKLCKGSSRYITEYSLN